MLRKYAELGGAHRCEPCQEYPGEYIIYHNGKEVNKCSGSVGESEARNFMVRVIGTYDDPSEYSMCWSASDDDPRVGQVWFTGFYKLDT